MSRSSGASEEIASNIVGFCWGVWAELGVSGWGRSHEGWAIDPEPLIVFTAQIGERDPRLRDEATDWCVQNRQLVSKARLRNLVRRQPEKALEAWGRFAATVNAAAKTDWPGATTPRPFTATGRSTLRPLTEPSMAYLRIRSIFGLGARAELLRFLLYNAPGERMTAQGLAEGTHYGKRNVAEAADALVQSGILRARVEANRHAYALADRGRLADVIGASPSRAVEWDGLLAVLGALVEVADRSADATDAVLLVETRAALRRIEPLLGAQGLPPPTVARGRALVEAWNRWAVALTGDLARGEWPQG